jgi:hypothetical protein
MLKTTLRTTIKFEDISKNCPWNRTEDAKKELSFASQRRMATCKQGNDCEESECIIAHTIKIIFKTLAIQQIGENRE